MHFDPNVSAVDQVSMAYDRCPPANLMAAAHAIDRARPGRIARVRVGEIHMKPATLVDLMAEVIAKAGAARRCVTLEDFARVGITKGQAETYKAQAFARAVADQPHLAELEAC